MLPILSEDESWDRAVIEKTAEGIEHRIPASRLALDLGAYRVPIVDRDF
jgi:hypothetical protein